jgi:hypothetical protein
MQNGKKQTFFQKKLHFLQQPIEMHKNKALRQECFAQ